MGVHGYVVEMCLVGSVEVSAGLVELVEWYYLLCWIVVACGGSGDTGLSVYGVGSGGGGDGACCLSARGE